MLSGRDNGYQVPHLEILAKVTLSSPLSMTTDVSWGSVGYCSKTLSKTGASWRAPLVSVHETQVGSSRPAAWRLVENPPRERPKACATWPPFFFVPLPRADMPAHRYDR